MDVLIETDLYKFDFVKLSEFFDKADLVRKVNGFIQSQALKEQQITMKKSEPTANSRSVLYAIKEFIRVLSYRSEDGKFIFDSEQGAL